MVSSWFPPLRRRAVALPYDSRHPLVFDKDDYLNGYTGEYLLALASAGELDLRAIVAGSLWPEADFDDILAGHRRYVEHAARSGFERLPEVVEGAFTPLRKPSSGRIEDTAPLDCPGTRQIVLEARRADSARPLVVLTGGSLTAVASAWLVEPALAERMIVVAALGSTADMGDYNGYMDPWAAYVVLQRLRYVQFPPGLAPPRVTKKRFRKLPPSELREWLLTKEAPYSSAPKDIDLDGGPAISFRRPDYVRRVRRVRFGRWGAKPIRGVPGKTIAQFPVFEDDPQGRALVVEAARADVATKEFWRAITDARAWTPTARASAS